jgi:hypothetical protein
MKVPCEYCYNSSGKQVDWTGLADKPYWECPVCKGTGRMDDSQSRGRQNSPKGADDSQTVKKDQ